MNKSADAYEFHFYPCFQIYGESHATIDAFLDYFPGNTADFSDAERQGFFKAANKYCLLRYNRCLTSEEKQLMHRFC
jgi:hypothetical protein